MLSSGLTMWRGWNDRIAMRLYVGACVGSCSVGRLWKRWTDTMKESLRTRGLGVRQARRMMQDGSEWQGFVKRNARGVAWGMNP